jgi:ribose 5-phosphate isomerase
LLEGNFTDEKAAPFLFEHHGRVYARTSKAVIVDERKELTVLENAQVLIEVRTDQLRAAIRQVSDLTQALHEAQKAIDGSDIAAAKKVIDAALSAKAASGGI